MEGVEILEVAKRSRVSDNPGAVMVAQHNSRLTHFHRMQQLESGRHKDSEYVREPDEQIDGQASYDLGCALGCAHPHRRVSSLLHRQHPNFVIGADV